MRAARCPSRLLASSARSRSFCSLLKTCLCLCGICGEVWRGARARAESCWRGAMYNMIICDVYNIYPTTHFSTAYILHYDCRMLSFCCAYHMHAMYTIHILYTQII
jgi:hypothetical protein